MNPYGTICLVPKPQNMFAIDTFHDHLPSRIRCRRRNDNTNSFIIPSGITSQLEPLDVSVNKRFKHLVCKHCGTWLNKVSNILTSSGKITRASLVVKWIHKAWKEVWVSVIPKSFLSAVCLMWTMTFFGTTVLQEMKAWLPDHWTDFPIF